MGLQNCSLDICGLILSFLKPIDRFNAVLAIPLLRVAIEISIDCKQPVLDKYDIVFLNESIMWRMGDVIDGILYENILPIDKWRVPIMTSIQTERLGMVNDENIARLETSVLENILRNRNTRRRYSPGKDVKYHKYLLNELEETRKFIKCLKKKRKRNGEIFDQVVEPIVVCLDKLKRKKRKKI